MDVAKVAALVARSGEPLASAYGIGQARGPRLPLVLVPTTAGTGSEVTPIAILTTGAAEKKGIVSPLLLPDLAILDAELTLGLPPAVTAATGVDAMVHAIEAYASASPSNNPISRGLARQALQLLGANIRIATHDGRRPEPRAAMLLGSLLAGQAFANSPVAAVHALAYPLGGRFHIPHGLSNALVLPSVLRFNLPAAGTVYAAIAADAFPDLAAVPEAARAEAFVEALATLGTEPRTAAQSPRRRRPGRGLADAGGRRDEADPPAREQSAVALGSRCSGDLSAGFLNGDCLPHPDELLLMRSATRSAIMMVGVLVLARGIVGMREASQTRRFSTPNTRPWPSVTAIGSSERPILQVPEACHTPPTEAPRNAVSATSSARRCSSRMPSVTAPWIRCGRSGPAASSIAPNSPRPTVLTKPGPASLATRGE